MATEFPEEYLKALDKVIELSSFTTKYQVKGAEFSAAKTVKIPELVFDGGTTDYDRFKSEGRVELRCTSSLPAWGVRSKYFGARMVSVSRLPSTASPSSTSLSVEQGLARPVSLEAFRHELPLLEAAGLRSRAKVAERSSAVAWRKRYNSWARKIVVARLCFKDVRFRFAASKNACSRFRLPRIRHLIGSVSLRLPLAFMPFRIDAKTESARIIFPDRSWQTARRVRIPPVRAS